MNRDFEITSSNGERKFIKHYKNNTPDSERNSNIEFCKKVHSNLKSAINASISTKIFNSTMVVSIAKVEFNVKFGLNIDNIQDYINQGEEGINEVTTKIGNEYSNYISNLFFY